MGEVHDKRIDVIKAFGSENFFRKKFKEMVEYCKNGIERKDSQGFFKYKYNYFFTIIIKN